MAEPTLPPPPPGFEMTEASPPPPGFVMGDQEAESASAVSGVVDAVRTFALPALTMIKKGALPTAGAIVGGSVGSAIGVGPIIGGSVGAGAGSALNQTLGITESSGADILMDMAMPPLASIAMGTLKQVGGSVLKAFGGRQNVAAIADDIVSRLYTPKVSSGDLFTRALSTTNPIQATKTAQVIDDVLQREAAAAPTEVNQAIINAVKPLELYFKAPNRSVAMIDSAVKDLRLASSAAYKSGNSRLGNTLSEIRNALFDDAEASGVGALKEAAKAYRRESAVEELGSVLRQAQPLKAFKDLQDKNALFRGAFDESEKTQIEAVMRRLAQSAPSGFSGVLGRVLASGAGAQVAGMGGAVVGGTLPDMAAYALSTAPGRRFMGKLLTGQNVWDAPKTAALATFVRAQMAEDASTGTVAQNVTKALQDINVPVEVKIQIAQERDQLRKMGGYSATADY